MIINVKLYPGFSMEKIEKISDGEFKIWVKERAEDNKANHRVINMLAKEFDIDFRKIKIKNPRSRKKSVEIIL